MSSPSIAALKQKTLASIGYKASARFISYGLQAMTTIVLAQNLSARDYGIVGFAMIFIGFLGSFNEMGVGSAVIQRKELSAEILHTAFTIRAALGTLAFGCLWFLAPFAATVFGDPDIISVLRTLSLSFIIGIFGFIPNLLLLRELEFKRWVVVSLISAAARAIVACALAQNGFGYWSIVIANLVTSVMESIGFMLSSHHSSRLGWNPGIARELWQFGFPLFSSGLLAFALFNADNLIIGSVGGAVALGFYAIAINWGSIFSKVIYEVFHAVLFPAFSRIQDDTGKLRRIYVKMMEQLGIFGILIQAGMIVCAPDFLVAVLGKGDPKWLPACTALQILAVYGISRLLMEPIANLVVARGAPKLLFRAALLATIVEIVLVYPVLKWFGIEGVAVLVTVAYTIQWIVYWPFLSRSLNLEWHELWAVLWPSLVAAVPASIAAILVGRGMHLSLLSLLAKAVAFTVLFFATQGMLSSWRWLIDWRDLIRERRTTAARQPGA